MAEQVNLTSQDYVWGTVRWIVKAIIFLSILALCLFTSAGTTDWEAGWVYLAVMLAVQVINASVLLAVSPDLLVERSQMQSGTKDWDKWLSVGMALVSPLLVCVAAGLDHRLGWTGAFNLPLQYTGVVFVILGSLLGLWAMVENHYFSATVRIQTERGHRVVDRGPYRVVRHPGYLGMAIYLLASPLALASWWAYLAVVVTIGLVVLRTGLEDATLKKELPGYQQYAARVPYRLVPKIW